MEGYLKKKCMVVEWSSVTVVLPKVYKYIVRYFFINGDHLCYTKTKKDYTANKPPKLLVDLTKVEALHVFETKMEVVEEGGRHIVLKTSLEEIKRWVPALAGHLPRIHALVALVEPPRRDREDATPISPSLSPTLISPSAPYPIPSSSPNPLRRAINTTNPNNTINRMNSLNTMTLFPLTSSSHEYPPTPPYYSNPILANHTFSPLSALSPLPPTLTSHALLRKLPSVRSASSLSFTLTSQMSRDFLTSMQGGGMMGGQISHDCRASKDYTSKDHISKQCQDWLGDELGCGGGNKTPFQSYTTGSPINSMGWDEWDAIFTKFQRNEEVY